MSSAKKNYAGSTAWHNGVRNRLVLSWSDKITESGEKVRTLSHEKANYSGAATPILLEWQNGCLLPIGEEVVESVLETLILGVVREAASKNLPLSRAPQSPAYIGKVRTIKDHKGKPINSKILMASVDVMLRDGRLIEIKGLKGDKYRKNGIFVAGEDEEIEDEADQAPFD